MTADGPVPGAPDPGPTAAWLLLAVGAASAGPVELAHLIGAADAIMHAIPTPDELAVGLGFLAGHRLIEIEGTTAVLTDRGSALLREADRRTWQATLARLVPLLAPLGPTSRLDLPPGAVEAAVAEHRRRSAGGDPGEPVG